MFQETDDTNTDESNKGGLPDTHGNKGGLDPDGTSGSGGGGGNKGGLNPDGGDQSKRNKGGLFPFGTPENPT